MFLKTSLNRVRDTSRQKDYSVWVVDGDLTMREVEELQEHG